MHEQRVRLALVDSEAADYLIFLSPFTQKREGPERVDDYLNGHRHFLPMVSEGVARIINREQILWVEIDSTVEPVGDEDFTPAETPATLELIDGTRYDGLLDMNRPPDRQRLSDVLNDDSEHFIRLTADAKTYFINKSHIRVAIPR